MKNSSDGHINVSFDDKHESLNESKTNPDLTEVYLDERYYHQNLKSENLFKNTANYLRKYYTPSVDCGISYLYKRVPFIKWIQTYDAKKCLVKDITAGLTVFIYLCFFNLD